jgi:nucleoside-diphosphate-sugar epimerase
MRVFVAGGSGTIGIPLVRALVRAGHQVTALTRTPSKQSSLRALGASPALADAFDRDALIQVVEAARPTHVIHQLTALPKEGASRARDLDLTNKLRIDGTRNLLDAAINAGARRFIGGSFAMLSAAGPGAPRGVLDAANAIRSMETQILDANHRGALEGIVLRYGLFYGPGNPATERMIALTRRRMLPTIRGDHSRLPCIHLDDAVSATVAALTAGRAGGVYDIVDDRAVSMSDVVTTLAESAGAPRPFAIPSWIPRLLMPYLAELMKVELSLSNAKARAELRWAPAYPTIREGVPSFLHAAA